MRIEPYLFFEGRCDEAIAFYKNAIGAELTALMRYKEGPGSPPPGFEEKVMHANLRIGEITVMLSDGRCGGQPRFEGFSLCLLPEDEGKARQMFESLSDGGEVQMPLGATFYSPLFGMVTDRFGLLWMVMVPA